MRVSRPNNIDIDVKSDARNIQGYSLTHAHECGHIQMHMLKYIHIVGLDL